MAELDEILTLLDEIGKDSSRAKFGEIIGSSNVVNSNDLTYGTRGGVKGFIQGGSIVDLSKKILVASGMETGRRKEPKQDYIIAFGKNFWEGDPRLDKYKDLAGLTIVAQVTYEDATKTRVKDFRIGLPKTLTKVGAGDAGQILKTQGLQIHDGAVDASLKKIPIRVSVKNVISKENVTLASKIREYINLNQNEILRDLTLTTSPLTGTPVPPTPPRTPSTGGIGMSDFVYCAYRTQIAASEVTNGKGTYGMRERKAMNRANKLAKSGTAGSITPAGFIYTKNPSGNNKPDLWMYRPTTISDVSRWESGLVNVGGTYKRVEELTDTDVKSNTLFNKVKSYGVRGALVDMGNGFTYGLQVYGNGSDAPTNEVINLAINEPDKVPNISTGTMEPQTTVLDVIKKAQTQVKRGKGFDQKLTQKLATLESDGRVIYNPNGAVLDDAKRTEILEGCTDSSTANRTCVLKNALRLFGHAFSTVATIAVAFVVGLGINEAVASGVILADDAEGKEAIRIEQSLTAEQSAQTSTATASAQALSSKVKTASTSSDATTIEKTYTATNKGATVVATLDSNNTVTYKVTPNTISLNKSSFGDGVDVAEYVVSVSGNTIGGGTENRKTTAGARATGSLYGKYIKDGIDAVQELIKADGYNAEAQGIVYTDQNGNAFTSRAAAVKKLGEDAVSAYEDAYNSADTTGVETVTATSAEVDEGETTPTTPAKGTNTIEVTDAAIEKVESVYGLTDATIETIAEVANEDGTYTYTVITSGTSQVDGSSLVKLTTVTLDAQATSVDDVTAGLSTGSTDTYTKIESIITPTLLTNARKESRVETLRTNIIASIKGKLGAEDVLSIGTKNKNGDIDIVVTYNDADGNTHATTWAYARIDNPSNQSSFMQQAYALFQEINPDEANRSYYFGDWKADVTTPEDANTKTYGSIAVDGTSAEIEPTAYAFKTEQDYILLT